MGELPEDLSNDPGQGVADAGNCAAWCCLTASILGPARNRQACASVPELVFVNCCHLGARSKGQLLTPAQSECAIGMRRRVRDSPSGVAEALISIGVRCVIAAGWAVDDEPARIFAETFYDALLRGEPLHRCRGQSAIGRLPAKQQHVGRVSVLRRPRLEAAAR